MTQTEFAFSHVLKDVSLVVFQVGYKLLYSFSQFMWCRFYLLKLSNICFQQLQTLAGFSAVIDRLGQFQEVMNKCGDKTISSSKSEVLLEDNPPGNSTDPLLELKQLTLMTPDSGSTLVKALDIKVSKGSYLSFWNIGFFSLCALSATITSACWFRTTNNQLN